MTTRSKVVAGLGAGVFVAAVVAAGVFLAPSPAPRAPVTHGKVGWPVGPGGGTGSGGSGSGLTPIAGQRILGNVSGGSATPTALTAAQVNTMLGTTSTWAATKLARAAAVSATLTGYWYEDFANNLTLAAGPNNASGTAKYRDATNTTYAPSCVTFDATGAQVANFVPSGNTGSIPTPKVTPWYIAWRAQMPLAPDNTDTVFLELRQPSGGPVAVGIRGAQSTTRFVLSIANTDFTISSANIDQVVHEWEMWFDGTNIVFALDGVTVATTATLTNMVTAAIGPSFLVQPTNSTQQLVVDKVLIAFPNGI